MTKDEESTLMTLKERLERGEYQVDSRKVADAVLRSPLWILLLAGACGGQGGARALTN